MSKAEAYDKSIRHKKVLFADLDGVKDVSEQVLIIIKK